MKKQLVADNANIWLKNTIETVIYCDNFSNKKLRYKAQPKKKKKIQKILLT